jgi:membrane complex biogenesis BtpA family protein
MTFGTANPVIGMVHLGLLPGAPKAAADGVAAIQSVLDRTVEDVRALKWGGIDGVMIENFGDAPFYPDDVLRHTVAASTQAAAAVSDATSLSIRINVLRDDAEAAVSVAAAVGTAFVCVNVHTGARVTDQGIVEGRAHETVRLRE